MWPGVSRRRWWATAAVCAGGVLLAGPEWVPRSLSREDGPIESVGFACFLVASVVAFAAARRWRGSRAAMLAVGSLGVLLFVAAGEEISWGQRLLGLETPAALVDGNTQDELNLHNLAGLQDKAVVAQLAVAAGGVLLARQGHRWARSALPFFAGYLAYRAGRVLAVVAGLGPADRNSEAAEVLLGVGLLLLSWELLVVASREPLATIDEHRYIDDRP